MSAPVPPSQPEAQGEAIATAQPIVEKKKRHFWPVFLVLMVLAAVAGGVGYHFLFAPTLSGTWEGQGSFGFEGQHIPFVMYLDLTQTDSTHVSGSGEYCSRLSTPMISTFKVSGTTTSDLHTITLSVGGDLKADQVQGSLQGGKLHIAFPSDGINLSATVDLAHGSHADFTAACNALPQLPGQ